MVVVVAAVVVVQAVVSVVGRHGKQAVMASHLLEHLGQAVEVAVGKMLGFPQVQDHPRRTGLGGKVV